MRFYENRLFLNRLISGLQSSNFSDNIKQNHKRGNMSLSNDKNKWFFQSNPKEYDILNALSDPEYKRMSWQINQHKHEIKKGDFVLIWVSGKEAGIYAVADIIEDPSMRYAYPFNNDKHCVSQKAKERAAEKRLRAIVETKHKFKNPIYRQELIEKGVNGSPVKGFYRKTNFKISEKDWHIIREILRIREPGTGLP